MFNTITLRNILNTISPVINRHKNLPKTSFSHYQFTLPVSNLLLLTYQLFYGKGLFMILGFSWFCRHRTHFFIKILRTMSTFKAKTFSLMWYGPNSEKILAIVFIPPFESLQNILIAMSFGWSFSNMDTIHCTNTNNTNSLLQISSTIRHVLANLKGYILLTEVRLATTYLVQVVLVIIFYLFLKNLIPINWYFGLL